MITGLVEATLVVTPVETMKTVLISDQNSANPKYRGLLHGVRSIIAERGVSGIYKGWTPTAAKQMGNQGIRFTTYEAVKNVSHGFFPVADCGISWCASIAA
jgi:solute carrier family 25 citrate transporter 1